MRELKQERPRCGGAQVKRCLYRAEWLEGGEHELASFFRWTKVSQTVVEAMKRLKVDHFSLFTSGSQLYVYYECLEEPVLPESLLAAADGRLATWPGEKPGRRWAPMMDIFHYQHPVSLRHWQRKNDCGEPYGRLALLKPDMVASYVYYHYQYQEEKPGDGDKYGIIGLHENVLFFYAEQPTTLEPAPYEGKLSTSLRPERWAEVMEPHFIKWEGAPERQRIWQKLELVLGVSFHMKKEEKRCVIRYA